MKMKLAAITCLLILGCFAFIMADNQGNGIHEFPEDWKPGSQWTDSFEAFDGHQISPATESTPALNAKENSVTSGEILPAYESYIQKSTTSALGLVGRGQSSGQSTIKNNDTEVKVVKRHNDGKENGWKSKFDPALIMMGLGKRIPAYDPGVNTIGFNSRQFLYYPSLKTMEMEKRKHHFDPALRYMGIGKRDRREISEDSSEGGIPYSTLEVETNINPSPIFDATPIFEGTTEADFEPRQVEGYPLEVMESLESSPFVEGNALNYKRSVSEKEDFESNRIERLKNKEDIPIPEDSNTVDDNHIDKSKDRSKDKNMVYEILGAKNRPEVLDVLRRNFGNNSPSIKYGVNGGIRLEISPKRFKELIDSNALSINKDVGKRNIGRQSSKKFSYDPALKYMGLGKRKKNRGGQISNYDPAFQYMGLGKRNDADATFKRESYDPAFKYMGLGKRNNTDVHSKRVSYDPAFQYMGLGKRKDGEVKRQSYDPAFQYMGLGKRKDAELNSKRESYDPAFKYMGLGKRKDDEVKRQSYDPAFQYMGLGKRKDAELNSKRESYDPAFQYMGLGKRKNVEINSKRESYDPAFQYMGLGKRNDAEINSIRKSYDPAFQYMGLGKHNNAEVSSKRESYDPAYQYMGLGKRKNDNVNSEKQSSDSGFKHMGFGKGLNSRGIRSANFDPALKYLGLGKRVDDGLTLTRFDLLYKRESSHRENYFHSLGEMSFEKSKKHRATPVSNYDPAFQYMGLGKKDNAVMSWDKREKSRRHSSSFDPAFKYMGLGKRGASFGKGFYDPTFKYMGLGKRMTNRDSRASHFDPALKYLGLGKRVVNHLILTKSISYDPSKKNRRTRRSANYDPALQYMGLGNRETLERQDIIPGHESELKRESNKRSSKQIASYNPALNYIGLGKRDIFGNKEEMRRSNKFDPTLQYMGLGNRQQHPKPLVLTNDVPSDLQLPESLFADSKRIKRQIESEEEDEAHPKLHRIDNIDTPQGILPFKTDDLERPLINMTAWEDDYPEEVILLPEHLHGPYLRECHYLRPCNRDPRNDEIMLPLIQASDISMIERAPPQRMQNLPEVKENETNSTNRIPHIIEDLPEIKTSEAISTDRAPYKIQDLPEIQTSEASSSDIGPHITQDLSENKTSETSYTDGARHTMHDLSDIPTHETSTTNRDLHIMEDLPENKTSETSSTDRARHIMHGLSVVTTSETSSTDRNLHRTQDLPENKTFKTISAYRAPQTMHGLPEIKASETSSTHRALPRIQDFPELKTSEASSTDRALHRIEELQDIKTPQTSSNNNLPRMQDSREIKTSETSSNNRVHRKIRDLLGIETSASSFSGTDPGDFYGIQAPETNSIETNPKIGHRQDKSRNKFEVEGFKRAMERSEYRIPIVKRNMMDIDNRPRYNPGWVFIGLGKRSSSSMDPKMPFLTKCYYLLGKINDALMRLQYRTKKFPLQLQPDPYGFTHKTVEKSMKGKNMKARARDLRVASRSFRSMKEDGK